MVADVYQPLVSVFWNALVFACAVLVFAYVSCVFSHSRPSKVRDVIVKRIPINVIHTSFVLWVWAPFFSNQAVDKSRFTAKVYSWVAQLIHICFKSSRSQVSDPAFVAYLVVGEVPNHAEAFKRCQKDKDGKYYKKSKFVHLFLIRLKCLSAFIWASQQNLQTWGLKVVPFELPRSSSCSWISLALRPWQPHQSCLGYSWVVGAFP